LIGCLVSSLRFPISLPFILNYRMITQQCVQPSSMQKGSSFAFLANRGCNKAETFDLMLWPQVKSVSSSRAIYLNSMDLNLNVSEALSFSVTRTRRFLRKTLLQYDKFVSLSCVKRFYAPFGIQMKPFWKIE